MKKYLHFFMMFMFAGTLFAQQTADNWTVVTSGVKITKDSTTVLSGKYSAKATWTSTSTQKFDADMVTVGNATNFEAKINVLDNDPGGRARIVVLWEGANNDYKDYTTDDANWQTLTWSGTVPTGATGATLEVRFYDVSAGWTGSATVYIDSVSFTLDGGSNLIANASFENWSGAAPATSYTIAQIQTTADGLEGDSPHKGEQVETSGIVTGVSSSGYYIQDGSGAWNGVWVFDNTNAPAIGDAVTITGLVDEYNGLTEITGINAFTITSSGNTLPAPAVITTAQVPSEAYEGVLVQVAGAKCTNVDLGFGEWEIDDGSGACRVDDQFYAFTPELNKVYTTITGIGNYAHGTYKIEPRDADDIYVVSSAPVIKSVTPSAFVPAADEDFTVVAVVTDNDSVASVQLQYVLDGQGDQPMSIDMTRSQDSVFTGTITADHYNNNTSVEYRLYATDVSGDTAVTDISGFLAGTSDISTLKQVEQDFTLSYMGFAARVTGDATVNNGTFSGSTMQVYMQDGTGGINIYASGAADTAFAIGHSYTVTGTVDFYNGLAELVPANPGQDIVDNGTVTEPAPLQLSIASLLASPEAFEGMLIQISNVDTVAGSAAWPTSGNNANITITDDGGTSELTMRIDRDTDIDDAPQTSYPANVVGIFTQYDSSSPYSEGYQILPRSAADITPVSALSELPVKTPLSFKLYKAYPNPFNPSTTLSFDLPQEAAKGTVELSIYNVLGQKIITLVSGKLASGHHTYKWNGINQSGTVVPSGIYFSKLVSSKGIQMQRMILLK